MSEKNKNDKIKEINLIISSIRDELSSINHTKTIGNMSDMVNFSQKMITKKEIEKDAHLRESNFENKFLNHENEVVTPIEELSGLESLVYKAVKDYIRPMLDEKLQEIQGIYDHQRKNFLDELIEKEVKKSIDLWVQKNLFTYFYIEMGDYCKKQIDSFFEQQKESTEQ